MNEKMNETSSRENNYTAGFLYTDSNRSGFEKSQKYVFCFKPGHHSSQSKTITNTDAKTDILKRFSKCYL